MPVLSRPFPGLNFHFLYCDYLGDGHSRTSVYEAGSTLAFVDSYAHWACDI